MVTTDIATLHDLKNLSLQSQRARQKYRPAAEQPCGPQIPYWRKWRCWSWTLLILSKIDPSQKPAPLSYCCYVQQAMPLSCHTSCAPTVKNTSWSKEETDNALSFQIFFFLESPTINTILWLFNVLWQIAVAPQFKRHRIISSSLLLL